jgi:hypothetical protein
VVVVENKKNYFQLELLVLCGTPMLLLFILCIVLGKSRSARCSPRVRTTDTCHSVILRSFRSWPMVFSMFSRSSAG